ncbi:MAG TPA: response regulator [Rhodocyclaceae bacterium]|nr:response regulator [Rhodocyclaceae bacterium]
MVARVLIVEDNAANLELMSYLLEAFGYKTTHARNGREALEIMARDLPDLVLCDIQMPEVDGFEVVRQAKSSEAMRKIVMVAVTAFAMVGDREKMLAAGFDGYISKPIQPEQFIPQIEAYLPVEQRSKVFRSEETQVGTEPLPFHGKVILIVDNMQTHLDLACSIFEYGGYTVLTARNPERALELCKDTTPCLIMSDVCMPQSNGYDLITAVKSDPKLKDVPFIFLTSTAQTEAERRKGLELGAVKYIFRPIEPDDLLAEVEACLKS